MLDYINCRQAHNANLGSINTLRDKSKYPSFKDQDIIIKKKAELIAGNYRVEALKKYLHRLKSSENERWWIYNIYNKGII